MSARPSGRKKRLPWACEHVADCWLGKLNWVQDPSFDDVHESALDLLKTVFTAWFRNSDYEKGLKLLEEFGNDEQNVMVACVFHYKGEPNRGMLHAKPKCGLMKKDLPVRLFFVCQKLI